MKRLVSSGRLATIVALSLLVSAGAEAAETFLAKNGQAQATIVVGPRASDFDRWVAGELQRYIRQLSGAGLPVATADNLPPDKSPLIVVGRPETNALLAAAEARRLVDFKGLKPEGLTLKTLDLDGRPAVLVGGNDEAGTMYAAYDFLERLGIVFQLTGDLIPEQKPDLILPSLDVRSEPAMKYRGVFCIHALRWYMGLEDFRKHIDQLAKLRINCLQFGFGIGGSPWVEFSYKGTRGEIRYPRESGYLAWGGKDMFNTSGTAKDVRVGRECFPQDYLGAPEFARVQTDDAAFATARRFLHEVIRYAHQRKVQVWLIMGEIPRVPANLAPADVEAGSKGEVGGGGGELADITWLSWSGRRLPNGHPDLVPIWVAAFESLIREYPEADSFGMWTSEASIAINDPRTRALIAAHRDARNLILPFDEITKLGNRYPAYRARSVGDKEGVLDCDFAELCVADQIVRAIKAKHPQVKLGVTVLFRAYLLRAMDALMPKDVILSNMDTYMNTRPIMPFYAGMKDRELMVIPRIDHDGCEFHMQLNLMQYDEDQIVFGAARYGLVGIIGQLNKERGLEVNARYLAEGAWNPNSPLVNAEAFYRDYATRVFGKEAGKNVADAYLLLEKALGFRVIENGVLFCGWTRFHLYPLDPSVEPTAFRWTANPQQALKRAQAYARVWKQRADNGRQAMPLLREALSRVLPGSRAELEYVIYKVETFQAHMELAVALNEARAALMQAELAKAGGDQAKYAKCLEECKAVLDRAEIMARAVAQQMIPYCGIPTEKYLLMRYNQNVIGSIEDDQRYLKQLMAQNTASNN